MNETIAQTKKELNLSIAQGHEVEENQRRLQDLLRAESYFQRSELWASKGYWALSAQSTATARTYMKSALG